MDFDASAEQLIAQIRQLDLKYRRVCEQLSLLHGQVDACRKRHDRATVDGNKCFRFSSRLRLVTLQHVAHAYWHYMSEMEERLDGLQDRLLSEHHVDWDELAAQEEEDK